MKNLIIVTGFILYFFFLPKNIYAKEMNYHNLLITYMSETGDTIYTKFVDDWMRAFRKQIWNKYKNDEFELDERREEIKLLISRDLKTYDPNGEYIINTEVEFGEYDFDKQEFSLHPFSTSLVFNVSSPIAGGTLPPNFKVLFVNPDIVDGLPMDKKHAKHFIQGRKSGGYFNRKLTAVIYCKFKSATADYKIKLEITNVQLVDKEDGDRVIYKIPIMNQAEDNNS